MSDKQDAFLKAVAAEFPGVPHRYCQNHFLRDVAADVLEADSHAKVKMRSKVRGLRSVERQVLAAARAPTPETAEIPAAAGVVLDYCAAVRGILNDDQGGPLQPPGLRMAEALTEVRASLQRNLDAKKGGARTSP
jgi:ATP-dependent Clp protease ATP-binding subunit ClpA